MSTTPAANPAPTTPAPGSTPAATPGATPQPGATPAPGSTPAATPGATPQPGATPAPGSTPAATPGATPQPGATSQPGATPVPQPALAAEPAMVSFRETISDQGLRSIADRYTSPTAIVQAVKDLRDTVAQSVRLPGENATDEDKAKFHKALGVPDTPAGYEVKLPDTVQVNDIDKQIIEQAKTIAHKAGVPAAVFNDLVVAQMEMNNSLRQQMITQINEFANTAQAQLKSEWGPDYSTNLVASKRAVETFGGDNFKKFVNTTQIPGFGMLGDHPEMVRFMATLGLRIGEGSMQLGNTPQEATSIQKQIDDLNTKVPPGSANYTTKAHQDALQGLFAKLHGNGSVVGAGGRQF